MNHVSLTKKKRSRAKWDSDTGLSLFWGQRILAGLWKVADREKEKVESIPGFSFSFLDRIPPSGGNGIPGEISLNFGNSDRKVFLNSKNEISLHSDRNFGFSDRNFGNFDRNFGFVTVKWCKLTENDVYIWKNWKFWQNFPWLCVYWQFIMHNIYITPQNNDKYTI